MFHRVGSRNKAGQFHSFNDKPLHFKYEGGSLRWFNDGKLHREDSKPAVIWADGKCEWWIDGEQAPEPPSQLVKSAGKK